MRRSLGGSNLDRLFRCLGLGAGRHVRAAPDRRDPTSARFWRVALAARPLFRLTAERPIPFRALRAAAADGVLVGHVHYEAGAALDPASVPLIRPDAAGFDVDVVAAFLEWDAATGEATLVAADGPDGASGAERLLAAWERAERPTVAAPARRPVGGGFRPIGTRRDFEDHVRETVRRIRAGDLFQANLARHFEVSLDGAGVDPLDIFRRLVDTGAAPYAAFSDFGGRAILSNTPELFLEVNGDAVRTRPIKGTTARLDRPEADRAAAEALRRNPKDRAENMMIVDLMRNDLARVCVDDGVRVNAACRLETYPAVHHLVSEVAGRLRAGLDAFDAFAAAFPPGSITGAPKWEAMTLIDRLEGRPRGAFCGSSFWIEAPDQAVFTVAIRTAEWRGDGARGRLLAAAGAGVTAASDPVAERCEIDHKMRALEGLLR